MSLFSSPGRLNLTLALLICCCGAASAQSDSSSTTAKRDKSATFYFSAYTGTTEAESSNLRIYQPSVHTDATYHDVDWAGKPFYASPYWGARFGYYPKNTPRVAIDFEYNHAKVYAKTQESKLLTGTWQGQPVDDVETISDHISEYRITNGINTLALNLIYRVPVSVSLHYPDGRWQPYVGAGPQWFLLYSINTIDGVPNHHEYYPSGWGWQAFTGIRYLVTPQFGVFGETKFQNGDAHSLISEDGTGYTALRIVHFDGGLYFQFR